MGRRKLCPETLRESGTRRKETFTKRTRGLFKKAHELAAMCGCAVYVAVGGEDGRLFHLHRLRNPHLDQLAIGSSGRALLDLQPSPMQANRQVSAVTAMQAGRWGCDDDIDAGVDVSMEIASEKGGHGVQVVSPLRMALSASPSPCVNNSTSPTPCINTKLWFYNHTTEKMEYSGIDSALPIDPSSACFPGSPCVDCLTGRSQFVGRIDSTPSTENIAVATPTYDIDYTVYDVAANHAIKPSPEFACYAPYEERLNSMSGPISSAESSPGIGNLDTMPIGNGGDDVQSGYVVESKTLPKVEPLDELDFLFPSIDSNPLVGFDPINWFDHPDFKV
ncbi:hypothetical protein GOP47_0012209 [Adiantum capillus-veneris]|uniref:MADS-box domain-containing protein n=1 Tax=Adiantum capillus-veneris TaxID=13818 RepID=A0A9D4UQ95_ADICA|nr:hypothetical protein GOP47_0012209 [Adiantum capillus-veneris]